MYPLGLILLLAIFSQCALVENSENVPEYLVNRLRKTKVEIAKAFIQGDTEPVISSSYDVEWVNLWSEKLHSERTLMISMFNKMCILEGNRVISVAVQPATNKTSSALQQVALIRQERPIKFAKSILWKSKLYLLVCHENDNACGLYTGKNDFHLKHRQIIKAKGWPMDAIFFTRANRLYLVVAHNTDQFPVSSVIYHWTGTYMDVIYRIMTVGAVSVTAFNYKHSTIIIFCQNEKRQPDIGSEIYEFHDNGLEMIQYLPTNGPISIHYYTHKDEIFLVVINELVASNVYWWDGNEFLHWIDLPNIVAPSMVNVAHFNGDTFFFVSYESHVTLYKVSSSEYLRLNLLELKNGERVVDMGVWIDERATLTLLLVTVDPNNLYRIEPWELRMKKHPNKNASIKESEGTTEHCLLELEARLNERMASIENVTRYTWPLLLPSAKNINISALNGNNRLEKLILHSGSITKLDVFSSEGILLASEIQTLAESSSAHGSRTFVNSILEESRKTIKIHEANRLVGDVIIQGNAIFQGLRTNAINVDHLNGQSINITNSISATKNQKFTNAQLLGKNITVQQLKIEQLCGIPYDYWLRDSNEKWNNIFLKNNMLDITNDTILLRTDLLSFNRLNLQTIDNIELDHFFNDLFIPSERQLIKGNIIQRESDTLEIGDLVIQELNGISQSDLMTVYTKQNLRKDTFVKTMSIKNLVAKKVNGVEVSKCAMVSKKNHIKGQVTLARMRILDELAIENPSKFPEVRPVQVYDHVTIVGNMKAEDLTLQPYTNFVLGLKNDSASEQSNIDSIVDSYWTKSTNQIIKNQVSLDAGLTIDELKLEYLNNLDINKDIMFTNVREINEEFGSLEFTNFNTSGWIVEETEDPAAAIPLWTSTDESLIVNKEFRIKLLGAQHLEIQTFNGIPVVEILNRNSMISSPYEYPVDSIQKFDSITVNERLKTEDLNLRYFNGQNEQPLENFLQFDADYKVQYLKAEKLTLGNVAFVSETGNFSALQKFSNYLQELKNSSEFSSSKKISLLNIDGDLVVEKDLQVVTINQKDARTYLEDLVTQDFAVSSEDQLIIDNLIVNGNLTLNLLQGLRIESLHQSILSKSRVQNLSDSRLSCYKISVHDLRSERINKRYTNNLVYTDSYISVGGDVTFTNLILSPDEDTQTKSLNGYPLNTLYKRLGEISLKQINSLTVNGNVSWESRGYLLPESKFELGPLDTIIKNALLKSSEIVQVINGETRISSRREDSPGVFVRWMNYKQDTSKLRHSLEDNEQLQGINLRQIINDAVLDDPLNDTGIQIVSKKSFAEDLKTSRLNVDGEIGIQSLNKWNVNDLNASIIRKESLSSLISEEASSRFFNGRAFRQDNPQGNTMIFRNNVNIRKLVILTKNDGSSHIPVIHGVPVSAIVLSTTTTPDKYLPNNTYLKHLEVKGNAFVKSLDNVDLDEFVRERVTINSNHEVHANLQFNGRVQVYQGAKVRTINGIFPSDFIVNNSHEDQIIVGEKFFNEDIEIDGKIYAPWIAGINLKEEYDNGVLNYQNIDIFGDVIFKADVEREFESIDSTTRWQLNPPGEGFVNAIRLRNFLDDRDTVKENILQGLKTNESRLELWMDRASNASSKLSEIFYYFESENDLTINVAKVDRVKVIIIKELTILNMYANELGSYCGLKNECPCRRQYVAEISSRDCNSRDIKGSRIVYNFHEPDGAFGVTVTTTSVSSSKTCTAVGDESSLEFTTISWMKRKPGNYLGANVTENALKIYGYLSDVEVFTQDDLVFIVLAIYYDQIQESHETNSLIYMLNLETNEINLAQGIPTSHAFAVQVFKIPSKGTHILFTSLGASEFGKSSESLLYRFESSTAKFELLRTFTTGGNRHAKSISQLKDEFLFLDDVATNSINVYIYNTKWDNFYFYQSLYHNSMSSINSIEPLYAREFRRSQVYVIVTTKHDQFFIYEYMFFGKFQIIAQKKVKGILTMVPFDVSSRRYVFMGTETKSTVLKVIEQGHH